MPLSHGGPSDGGSERKDEESHVYASVILMRAVRYFNEVPAQHLRADKKKKGGILKHSFLR